MSDGCKSTTLDIVYTRNCIPSALYLFPMLKSYNNERKSEQYPTLPHYLTKNNEARIDW